MRDSLASTAVAARAKQITRAAEDAAAAMSTVEPLVPPVLLRVNYRFLVTSLERHGISDTTAACALAHRYFLSGDVMTTNHYARRWQQILQSCEMSEDAKHTSLDRLLARAEARRGLL